MIIQFTDSEYGEIMGSLANTRDNAKAAGRTAPHVLSALEKMCKWGSPAGCQFLVVTGEDANLIAAVTEPVKAAVLPPGTLCHDDAKAGAADGCEDCANEVQG